MTKQALYKKLNKAIKEVRPVQKSGYNSHQRYHYVTESDIMEAVKPALFDNGLHLSESSRILDIRELTTKDRDGNDKKSFMTTVETTHTLTDVDTGESTTVTSIGSGHDSTDKGVFKAITGSNKYYFMKNWFISGEDDPENDGVTKPTMVPQQVKTQPTAQVKQVSQVKSEVTQTAVKPTSFFPAPAKVAVKTQNEDVEFE